MENKTVILFFARTAAAEMRHKKLCNKGNTVNSQLHLFLYKKTLTEIYKTGLPFIVYHQDNQIGDDFGTKYNNAIKDCFNKGYDSVIAVGSDCPQLKAADILYSHQQLIEGNNVLGPDNRGGIYLMGIQQKQFADIDLKNIKWHSKLVFSQLKSGFASLSVTTFLLHKLNDVNVEKDILKLIKQYAKNTFAEILQQIIFGTRLISSCFFHYYKQFFYLSNTTFRGPPALLFI